MPIRSKGRAWLPIRGTCTRSQSLYLGLNFRQSSSMAAMVPSACFHSNHWMEVSMPLLTVGVLVLSSHCSQKGHSPYSLLWLRRKMKPHFVALCKHHPDQSIASEANVPRARPKASCVQGTWSVPASGGASHL